MSSPCVDAGDAIQRAWRACASACPTYLWIWSRCRAAAGRHRRQRGAAGSSSTAAAVAAPTVAALWPALQQRFKPCEPAFCIFDDIVQCLYVALLFIDACYSRSSRHSGSGRQTRHGRMGPWSVCRQVWLQQALLSCPGPLSVTHGTFQLGLCPKEHAEPGAQGGFRQPGSADAAAT